MQLAIQALANPLEYPNKLKGLGSAFGSKIELYHFPCRIYGAGLLQKKKSLLEQLWTCPKGTI